MMLGTYTPPRYRPGQQVHCLRHGLVTVCGANNLGWPVCRVGGAQGSAKIAVILTAELADAVRRESVRDICRLAGVSRDTVRRWRRRLSVPRYTEGTLVRWRELRPRKLTSAVVRRGGEESARRRRRHAKA
jgi:hypothetical protein